MEILDVDKARTAMVIKRGMGADLLESKPSLLPGQDARAVWRSEGIRRKYSPRIGWRRARAKGNSPGSVSGENLAIYGGTKATKSLHFQ
jgi:hypothetical protein